MRYPNVLLDPETDAGGGSVTPESETPPAEQAENPLLKALREERKRADEFEKRIKAIEKQREEEERSKKPEAELRKMAETERDELKRRLSIRDALEQSEKGLGDKFTLPAEKRARVLSLLERLPADADFAAECEALVSDFKVPTAVKREPQGQHRTDAVSDPLRGKKPTELTTTELVRLGEEAKRNPALKPLYDEVMGARLSHRGF